MFRTLMLGLSAVVLGTGALAIPTAAGAQRYGGERYDRARGDADRDGYDQAPRQRSRDGRDSAYPDRRYRDGSRRCNGGTTGTILGAIAGGLLGRSIDTRGDRSLGTVLGAGGGALAGRAVERSGNPGWCR